MRQVTRKKCYNATKTKRKWGICNRNSRLTTILSAWTAIWNNTWGKTYKLIKTLDNIFQLNFSKIKKIRTNIITGNIRRSKWYTSVYQFHVGGGGSFNKPKSSNSSGNNNGKERRSYGDVQWEMQELHQRIQFQHEKSDFGRKMF